MIPAQIARQNSMPDSIDELSSDSSGLSDLELTNSNTEIIYEVDLSTLFYNSTDDSSTELFNPEYFGDISGETEVNTFIFYYCGSSTFHLKIKAKIYFN